MDKLDIVLETLSDFRKEMNCMATRVVENSTVLELQSDDLRELKAQMKTALMPILFAKWTVAVIAGLATIGGFFYSIFSWFKIG